MSLHDPAAASPATQATAAYRVLRAEILGGRLAQLGLVREEA